MAEKTYRGKAPLTLVLLGEANADDARFVTVYRGAPVPSGATPETLKRLEDEGFIEAGSQLVGLLNPEPSQRKV